MGEKRGFLLESAGAKTNPRLFHSAASRPTSRGHESNSGRPRSGTSGKSTGYFREKPRPIPKEILCIHVLRTAEE
jgi:hypothetical protein